MRSIVGSAIQTIRNEAPVPIGSRDTLFAPGIGWSKSKRRKYLDVMEAQSTIFAIVDRISTSIAAVPWNLYFNPTGEPEDRERVTRHPALTVWNKPNPFQTRSEFLEASFQHYELTGEWFWVTSRAEILNGGGPPVELWLIRPDKMTPVPSRKKFIAGYVYQAGSEKIPLTVDDVIFNRRPSPINPYRGISPVSTLLVDIEGETAAAKWNTQFFKNGAQLSGMISVPGELDEPEFNQLLDRWRASHQGVNNAHSIGVLEGGTTWDQNQYSQKDMQFEQLRRYSRDTFREAWGFPKAMLGDVEDVNRANAEAGAVVLANQLLVPRLDKVKTSLNDDFLPMFGPMGTGYEFDYENPVPPNREDERATLTTNVTAAGSLIDRGFDPAATLAAFHLPEIPMTEKVEV